MTINELIAECERLDKEATPGPMRAISFNSAIGDTGDYEGCTQIECIGHRESDPVVCEIWNPEDSEVALMDFFARSRTLLPLLVKVIKNQQRRIELAEETLKRLRGRCDDGAARFALYNMGQLAAELEDIK